MGQAKRRKAEIDALKLLPRLSVVAVHEAGHAVARYLTAADMGIDVEEAVTFIEIHDPKGQQSKYSSDGRATLTSQAVTFGPTLSKEIEQAALPVFERYVGEVPPERQQEFREEVMRAARAAGCDIGRWLRARAIIAVSGAMAEAKFTGRAFEDVFGDYACESDLSGLRNDFVGAGTEGDLRVYMLESAFDESRRMIGAPHVWRAILELAERLPHNGRMEGAEVASILGRVINDQALA